MRWLSLLLMGTLTTTTAWAGPEVSGFLQQTTAQKAADDLGNGGGVRVGMTANLLIVHITPEVGIGVYEQGMLAPHLGAKVRFGKIIEPGAYAHYWVSAVPGAPQFQHGYDAGLSLDFTAIANIDIGAHVGFIELQKRDGNERHHTLGAQVSYSF